MPNTPVHLIAGGDIRPFRFVKMDGTDAHEGKEADANERVIGICGGSTNQPPLSDLVLTALHAIEGQQIRLYGEGDQTILELGDTVTPFQRLKSDADGKGVPIATSGTTIQHFGAVALEGGSAGDRIEVQVQIGSERPDPS